MIIETTDNRLYRIIRELADIPQCWLGIEVKRTKAGYVPKAKARPGLVRKEASRVVEG